ncbi:excisionase [Amycolatopsis antarctica]|uniref:Excisionase n=1 Tax=Amycolatopsis antarctica TaxID=1854586 RepID=A0A263D4Y8_9PSEU|nr:helix-turn-helix domain-containing protein [Amycolatopsis antarctica]OZM73564.1 excisionase [Amycolatopsis antarctica]
MSAKLWTITDLSDHLGVPVGTLYQWRTKGYGPTGRRIGKHVRYRPEDVDTWITNQDGA